MNILVQPAVQQPLDAEELEEVYRAAELKHHEGEHFADIISSVLEEEDTDADEGDAVESTIAVRGSGADGGRGRRAHKPPEKFAYMAALRATGAYWNLADNDIMVCLQLNCLPP